MVDRLNHIEPLPRSFDVADGGEGDDSPDPTMSVLAAFLANAGT